MARAGPGRSRHVIDSPGPTGLAVLSQFTHLTDRRTDGQTYRHTDGILIARPRLHSMQRGKNQAHTKSSSSSFNLLQSTE